MEGGKQTSLKDSYPIDICDPKYVSGLSTILVATIEEAKDRISQIEYIFCQQLFPDFQSKSRSLQKIHSEAKRAAEDAFKEKEKDLLLQIEKHHMEMRSVTKQNDSLQLERKRLMDSEDILKRRVYELQEKLNHMTREMGDEKEKQCNEIAFNMLQEKINRELEVKLQELHQELANKSKEVDEGLELQKELVQMVASKEHLILQKDKQLKEQEVMVNDLISKNESFRSTCNNLEERVKEKIEQLEKGQVFQENLAKQIELQTFKINNDEKLLSQNNAENELLRYKVQNLEETMNMLHEEHAKKIKEQLHDFEEKEQKLQLRLKEASIESYEGITLHGKLLEQIKEKDIKIHDEKKINKELISSYKRLKSENLFLRKKLGLTPENMLPEKRKFDEVDSSTSDAYALAFTTMEHPKEENIKQVELQSSLIPRNPSTSAAPVSKTGLHSSSWRNTRLHQQRDGPDPHDDFLDTPLENIRENIKKGTSIPDPSSEKKPRNNLDDNDEEEQEKKREAIPKPLLPQKDFKFTEPVRKKADRENLKGIECKQCKKFYDAVLNGDGNKQELRCEHHEGVSRHRYRYAPPLTPEGFWNIGFDSEI